MTTSTTQNDARLKSAIRAYLAHAMGIPVSEDGLAKSSLDWERALANLNQHRLASLAPGFLFDELNQVNMPAFFTQALRDARDRARQVHLTSLQALSEVIPSLRQAGISCAVLKGPHIYEAFYSDANPRSFGDIDLLVRRGNVNRALQILAPLGYHPVGSRWDQFLARHSHFHIVLKKIPRGVPPVELHWSLVDRANLYRMEDASVLDRAVEFSTGRASFPTMSREDHLIYLCLHAAKHGTLNGMGLQSGQPVSWFCRPNTGNRLAWFLDIDLLLQKDMDDFDWRATSERIHRWNVEDDVASTLRLLQLIRPESYAPVALTRLGLDKVQAHKSNRGIFLLAMKTAAGNRMIEWSMRMNKRLFIRPVRLLVLGGLLFPSPRRLSSYYRTRSSLLLPLLYLIHPFNMIRRLFS